jgi:hypothetical protein
MFIFTMFGPEDDNFIAKYVSLFLILTNTLCDYILNLNII